MQDYSECDPVAPELPLKPYLVRMPQQLQGRVLWERGRVRYGWQRPIVAVIRWGLRHEVGLQTFWTLLLIGVAMVVMLLAWG